jgi:hypothetical protein
MSGLREVRQVGIYKSPLASMRARAIAKKDLAIELLRNR